MRKRLYFLDSLRGLAALAVVVYHLPLILKPPLPVPDWISAVTGGGGVTLFFVISAFSLSLTMPLHEQTGRPLLSFYIKRLLRIAPLFYLVAGYGIVSLYRHGAALPTAGTVALNAAFLFNLVPAAAESLVFAGWTIGVEMLFYLAFPFINRWFSTPWRKLAALLLSLAAYPAFVGALDQLSLPSELRARYALLTIVLYLPAFFSGMLAFDLYKVRRDRDRRTGIGMVFSALALCLYALMDAGHLDTVLVPAQLQAICFGLLLFGISLVGLPAVIGTGTRFLGTISYSVYLLHDPVIVAANPLFQRIYRLDLPLNARFPLAVVAALVVIIPVCWVTYNLVERPGIALAKAIVVRLTRRTRHAEQDSPAGGGSMAPAKAGYDRSGFPWQAPIARVPAAPAYREKPADFR